MKYLKLTVPFIVFFLLFSCQKDEGTLNTDTTKSGSGKKGAAMKENQNMTAGVAWPQFHRIKIGFLNGTTAQQDTVKKYAKIWDDITNLEFEYVSNPADAEIRIEFSSLTKSGWSYIGYKDNLSRPKKEATMALYANLGLNSKNYLFGVMTIRHEFGHMLGLVHEQLRPDSQIDWVSNKTRGGDAILMQDFKNYLRSDYDIYSIMHYSVKSTETNNGQTVDGYINGTGELSAHDIEFIQKIYPLNGTATSATTLSTLNP